jgi:hypothetical protein
MLIADSQNNVNLIYCQTSLSVSSAVVCKAYGAIDERIA